MSAGCKKRIGLTGGIGAGKSTVSARLRRLGAMVLDADIAARQAVEPGTPGLAMLIQRYGAGILQQNGELDRRALAQIIFGEEAERLAVNALLHPMVRERMLEQERLYRTAQPCEPVFWDVPLLIESGMHKDMDEVWLVVADEAARISRIMLRDGSTRAEASARINSQMPQQQKLAFAHRVLDNSGDQVALYKRVDALYAAVKGTQE